MWGRNPRRNMTDVNVYTARRLDDMAQSLGLLAKNCEDEIDHGLAREDALAAMQVSAATVCGSCSRCNLYRDSEKEESYYPYYLLRAFEQKGQVEFADMPRFFSGNLRTEGGVSGAAESESWPGGDEPGMEKPFPREPGCRNGAVS